jgi:hypothetical protein
MVDSDTEEEKKLKAEKLKRRTVQGPDPIPEEIKDKYYKSRRLPNMLDDYDVIGFSVEHSLVKFNVRELTKLFISEHLKALLPLGYPQDICRFDFNNLGVCLNNTIWDVQNGTILKLGEGKRILTAIRGFNKLSDE